MKIEFISKIRIANKNGTGFISIPKEIFTKIKIHDNVEVLLNEKKFFSQIIKWGSIGIYIPRDIAKDFLGKEVSIKLENINDCYAKIGSDGRIYIPLYKSEELKLKDKDIVIIKIIKNNDDVKEIYSQVNIRKRHMKTEYICFIGSELARNQIRLQSIRARENKLKVTLNN